MLVSQSCWTLCDPIYYSPPGSSVHGSSKQEYWSGLSLSSPEDLPNSGTEPRSPALETVSLPSELQGSWHNKDSLGPIQVVCW